MQSIQTQIGNLPLFLHCISNGNIGITAIGRFNTFVDGDVIIDMEGVHFSDENIEYGVQYSYKEMPSVLEWLQRQNLISPIV